MFDNGVRVGRSVGAHWVISPARSDRVLDLMKSKKCREYESELRICSVEEVTCRPSSIRVPISAPQDSYHLTTYTFYV